MALHCKVLEHKIKLKYKCPFTKDEVTVEIDNPSIGEGSYFSDWHYTYTYIYECESCGKSHNVEI